MAGTSTEPEASVPFLDLYGSDYLTDPHAVLRACRDQSSHAQTVLGPAVLGYAGVQQVVADRRFRTPGADFLAVQGITEGPLVDLMQGLLVMSDGDAHDRVRRLVSKAFTVRRVEAFRSSVRTMAEDLARGLAERLADGEVCDFIATFAEPFARGVLCGFVGIPDEAQSRVLAWTADIGLAFGLNVAEHSHRIEASLASLNQVSDELTEARRREPADDLISALVVAEEAGVLMSEAELRCMMITLMAAGHGTSVHQLGHGLAAFAAHRDQWELLVADPGLAASAAEEVVRFSPASLLGIPRVTKEDVVHMGLPIAAGSLVLPVTGSANRDGSVFDDPDSFDIALRRPSHLTFGGGIHACLGALLARIELQEALTALAAAVPAFGLAGAGTWLPPTELVWGPVELPIANR